MERAKRLAAHHARRLARPIDVDEPVVTRASTRPSTDQATTIAPEGVPAACEATWPSTEACDADESPASVDLMVEQPEQEPDDPGDVEDVEKLK
jgi:hypothetical protein